MLCHVAAVDETGCPWAGQHLRPCSSAAATPLPRQLVMGAGCRLVLFTFARITCLLSGGMHEAVDLSLPFDTLVRLMRYDLRNMQY